MTAKILIWDFILTWAKTALFFIGNLAQSGSDPQSRPSQPTSMVLVAMVNFIYATLYLISCKPNSIYQCTCRVPNDIHLVCRLDLIPSYGKDKEINAIQCNSTLYLIKINVIIFTFNAQTEKTEKMSTTYQFPHAVLYI